MGGWWCPTQLGIRTSGNKFMPQSFCIVTRFCLSHPTLIMKVTSKQRNSPKMATCCTQTTKRRAAQDDASHSGEKYGTVWNSLKGFSESSQPYEAYITYPVLA
mmetsp:Transcript_68196/g.120638  ORF Transcript_68196/g.120638 Transcript_68196/m.120638 type:complete len:103 (+) Transcript_68196:1503-1811(+)